MSQYYNKTLILLVERQSGRRVLVCDWLDLGVKVKSTANADVDFCSKMASLTAAVQTNRSGSTSSSTKRTGMMSQIFFGIIVFVCLLSVSRVNCALADGKTLVLLDNLNIRDSHSIFFRSLAGLCEICDVFHSFRNILSEHLLY